VRWVKRCKRHGEGASSGNGDAGARFARHSKDTNTAAEQRKCTKRWEEAKGGGTQYRKKSIKKNVKWRKNGKKETQIEIWAIGEEMGWK